MKQIFKENIPIDYFLEYIKNNSILVDDKYIYNKECFKRSYLNDNTNISLFLNYITPYYHISKRYYVERNIKYNSFLTILRQISKSLNINYKSSLKYINSSYDISYTFDI
jgi:hypothetical protein